MEPLRIPPGFGPGQTESSPLMYMSGPVAALLHLIGAVKCESGISN